MDEGVVRMAAEMYALVAQMEAIKTRVHAMVAENAVRVLDGYSPSYTSNHFFGAESELSQLAERFRQEI